MTGTPGKSFSYVEVEVEEETDLFLKTVPKEVFYLCDVYVHIL